MNILSNGFDLPLAAISSSFVAFTQLMLRGGKLRFKWERNCLEVYVEMDSNGASK